VILSAVSRAALYPDSLEVKLFIDEKRFDIPGPCPYIDRKPNPNRGPLS